MSFLFHYIHILFSMESLGVLLTLVFLVKLNIFNFSQVFSQSIYQSRTAVNPSLARQKVSKFKIKSQKTIF